MSVWAQRLATARTGLDGLILDRWMDRQAASAPATLSRSADLRMVPLAAAAWGAAWVGTWVTAVVIAAAAAAVAVALAVAALRRSPLVLSAALVATVIMGAGVVDVHRLRHGPVALLAEHQAVVSMDLEIRADLHRVATSGIRAGAAVTKAVTVRVEGRGSTWLVRAPVLVVVTGQQLEKWFETPVGTRVAVQGRLEAPDRGSDVAAVLRVRGSPEVVERPSQGLRLVERVRAGLRRAVADRRPEPRGLVPALVLGDTSGLDAELTQDFQATGLARTAATPAPANRGSANARPNAVRLPASASGARSSLNAVPQPQPTTNAGASGAATTSHAEQERNSQHDPGSSVTVQAGPATRAISTHWLYVSVSPVSFGGTFLTPGVARDPLPSLIICDPTAASNSRSLSGRAFADSRGHALFYIYAEKKGKLVE